MRNRYWIPRSAFRDRLPAGRRVATTFLWDQAPRPRVLAQKTRSRPPSPNRRRRPSRRGSERLESASWGRFAARRPRSRVCDKPPVPPTRSSGATVTCKTPRRTSPNFVWPAISRPTTAFQASSNSRGPQVAVTSPPPMRRGFPKGASDPRDVQGPSSQAPSSTRSTLRQHRSILTTRAPFVTRSRRIPERESLNVPGSRA